MLIDDRIPPFRRKPPEGRRIWDPNWRQCGWVAATVGAGVGAAVVPGIGSFVLACTALGCGAHAFARAFPYAHGLREHRQ